MQHQVEVPGKLYLRTKNHFEDGKKKKPCLSRQEWCGSRSGQSLAPLVPPVGWGSEEGVAQAESGILSYKIMGRALLLPAAGVPSAEQLSSRHWGVP